MSDAGISGPDGFASDGGPEPEGTRGGDVPDWVLGILRCPVTGAALAYGAGPKGELELHSDDPERPLAYPVRDGIPVLLESDARPL